jgi:hypothetical protein
MCTTWHACKLSGAVRVRSENEDLPCFAHFRKYSFTVLAGTSYMKQTGESSSQ